MFDPAALHEARERNGAAADDRPEDVDDVMAAEERLGFKNELPLLDRDYSEYPDGGELYRPAMGDTLRSLVDHDKVGSAEDIADELNTDVETVEKACDLHGVTLPDGSEFDIEVTLPRLHALLGADYPDELVKVDNPITTAILYVEKGLSVAEIAEVFTEVSDYANVPKQIVRQTLVDAGVLGGTTTDEQEARMKQNRGTGLTIQAGDY